MPNAQACAETGAYQENAGPDDATGDCSIYWSCRRAGASLPAMRSFAGLS
jgi:hypothetical protein